MIHLIFGIAADSGLKHAFQEQNHQIIGFPTDFSTGPINHIHQPEGIKEHFNWKASSFQEKADYDYGMEQVAFQRALKQLSEIKEGDKLTIWTCENASEQIGLRISCYLLKEKKVELTLINTAEAMKEYMNGKGLNIDIRTTAECNMQQLLHFYTHSNNAVTKEMRKNFEQAGEELLQRGSIVRSWKQGEIIDELETRDDEFIMEYTKREEQEGKADDFIIAARVVGGVLGESDQILSDLWIEYRIRSLLQSGCLMYKGSLQSMRMYSIKVA
ncbi:DUF1835 domain-containing protein [Oceanobacillus jeddahense]|uniref:DUF1835 domain-containing protein n=1 Tax=Oceanobacillus jeddahense TaxID=1462527 RepID=A0ABY5JLL0_9BACI|nr:DUF1835 domain-containing protein [Oceanobacillus jeddahense]UUI01183.1 DUF1835 domain-containing protein [Oceanobacillus jeddahense]